MRLKRGKFVYQLPKNTCSIGKVYVTCERINFILQEVNSIPSAFEQWLNEDAREIIPRGIPQRFMFDKKRPAILIYPPPEKAWKLVVIAHKEVTL